MNLRCVYLRDTPANRNGINNSGGLRGAIICFLTCDGSSFDVKEDLKPEYRITKQ